MAGIDWSKVTSVQFAGIARDQATTLEIEDDNAEIIANAIRQEVKKALEAIGIQATGDVQAYMTEHKIVDTGRLRASITHQLDPKDDIVYIGTNVEYGPPVEQRKGYLTNTMNAHGAEYREYLREAMENAPEPS